MFKIPSAAKATVTLTKCRAQSGDVTVPRLRSVLNARVGISIQSNLL